MAKSDSEYGFLIKEIPPAANAEFIRAFQSAARWARVHQKPQRQSPNSHFDRNSARLEPSYHHFAVIQHFELFENRPVATAPGRVGSIVPTVSEALHAYLPCSSEGGPQEPSGVFHAIQAIHFGVPKAESVLFQIALSFALRLLERFVRRLWRQQGECGEIEEERRQGWRGEGERWGQEKEGRGRQEGWVAEEEVKSEN